MTVNEMLNIPFFSDMIVAGGQSGLSREVTSVSVMDAPDIYEWMKGGEFLITTAYIFKDSPGGMLPLIRRLNDAGVAAFGIKADRFLGELPEEVVAEADRIGLPLIFVHNRYSWIEVISTVLNTIIGNQSDLIQKKNAVHEQFISLAASGKNTEAILRQLQSYLRVPVVYVDVYFNKYFFSNEESSLANELKAVAPHLFDRYAGVEIDESGEVRRRELYEQYDVSYVASDDVRYGLIIAKKGTFKAADEISRVAIDYAGVTLLLDEQKRISNFGIEEKYRDAFISDLIFNNSLTESEIVSRAQIYGWDFSDGGCVLVLNIENLRQAYLKKITVRSERDQDAAAIRFMQLVGRAVTGYFPNARYYKQNDHIIYILSVPVNERTGIALRAEQLIGSLREIVRGDEESKIYVSLGRYYPEIRQIGLSYREAQTAMALAEQLHWDDRLISCENMGVYRFLTAVCDQPAAGVLIETYIEPMLDYDKRHHTRYFETLGAVINSGWNLKIAAVDLYIHYNTLKYRIKKMGELLEVPLDGHEIQFCVETAYRLYELSRINFVS